MITLDTVVKLLSYAIVCGTVYLFATLGEIITQRSGIMNLGAEGMVMFGAVASALVVTFTKNVFLGTLAGMAGGALLAAVHAFICIKLKASQVASGLTLTILGVGAGNFLGKQFKLVGNSVPATFKNIKIPLLGDIPVIGEILFNQNLLVYVGYILVIVLSIFMFKTRAGMRLRAVGENPAAADAAGINVFGIKYGYTIFGGALSGLSGAYLVLALQKSFQSDISGGAGWLAVALVIFALWRPALALLGSFMFGLIVSFQVRLSDFGLQNIPPEFIKMIPYAATIIVLILVSGKVRRSAGGPAALGVPYDREER